MLAGSFEHAATTASDVCCPQQHQPEAEALPVGATDICR